MRRALAILQGHPGLAVFTLALVARIAWVIRLPDAVTWIDEEQFVAIAHDLVHGRGYTGSTFRGNPLLPWYLAAFFRLFGETYLWPRIGQAAIGALTCVLAQRIGDLIGGARVGLAAGLLCAFYPAHIYLAGFFYVDVLFTFFLLLVVLLLVRAAAMPSRTAVALAVGVALGLGVLSRPIMLVLVPASGLLLVWGLRSWRERALAAGVMAIGLAVVVLPWTARNYVVHKRFMLVGSGFATKLWEGNNELAWGDADDRDLRWTTEIWRRRLAMQPADEQVWIKAKYDEINVLVDRRYAENNEDYYQALDDVLGRVALRYIIEHPVRTAELFGRKIATLYAAFTRTYTANEHTSSRNRLIAAATYYPILLLAAVGTFMARRIPRRIAPLLAMIASLSAAYGLLNACTRFRLPLDPLLMVLAAVPVAAVWDRAAAAAAPAAHARMGAERAAR